MPTCRKCGKPHFNFVSCEDAAAPLRVPERFLRPREGARDFGNRTHTMQGRDTGLVVSFIPRAAHPMYVPSEPPKEAA